MKVESVATPMVPAQFAQNPAQGRFLRQYRSRRRARRHSGPRSMSSRRMVIWGNLGLRPLSP
jgi:hypothetical protein